MVIFGNDFFFKVVVVEFSIEGLCKIFPQKGLLCTMDHEHTMNSKKQPRHKTKTQNSQK